jgi:hypothetical protein
MENVQSTLSETSSSGETPVSFARLALGEKPDSKARTKSFPMPGRVFGGG